MKALGLLLFVLCVSVLAGEFDVKDEAEFAKIVAKDAKVEKLASGMKFLEGPVWIQAEKMVVYSDIPNNTLVKWSAKDGPGVFRNPSNNSNGTYLNSEGLLLCCEHSSRRVTRTERDGSITVLADSYDGKKLNSPNDLAVKSDGTIWFTDPPYGIPKTEKQEQPKNFVFRLDPKTKVLKALVDDFDRPNGICFSPDEKKLYVADSGKPRHIRVFDVNDDGTVANGKVFCAIDKGAPDGIRCDTEGRLYSSSAEGVQIFKPDGTLIGKILVPESPANLCFGGDSKKTLFITARTSLYKIELLTTGAQKP
ncbi:MAG TPA: SMP-30/gluconolactonase/LRE family protein [Planctomycetota bacterium]|nr:SMP-30/gluconolactonase/LRE family protein [Planctomycetota bacterium]